MTWTWAVASNAEPRAVVADVPAGAERRLEGSGGGDLHDGFIARFDVSRDAPGRKRAMKLVFPSGEVEIDFLTRAFRNTTPFALNPDFADTPAGKDPLGASVEGFLQAVRGRAPRPVVTAPEAIRALDLALAVERALETRDWIGAPQAR